MEGWEPPASPLVGGVVMKYRGIFVAIGAGIGLAYLAAGTALLDHLEFGAPLIQAWVMLAGLGTVVNAITASVWSADDETPRSVRRLLWVQTYLPLAVAAIGVA